MPQWDIKLDGHIWSPGVGSVSCAELTGDARDRVVLIDRDGDGLAE